MALSCDTLGDEGCRANLAAGFLRTSTGLFPTRSECVPASSLDSNLDQVAVCHCEYRSPHFYSDTGDSSPVDYTIGLARLRMGLGLGGDSCEVLRGYAGFGNVCLIDSSEFAGCSLDAAETSCEASCEALSQADASFLTRTRANVEVLASQCRCGAFNSWSDACVGVLRVADTCFFSIQDEWFGYEPRATPCDAPPEQMLAELVSDRPDLARCPEPPPPCTSTTSSDSNCSDASTLDAGTLAVGTADASTTDAARPDAATLDAQSAASSAADP
jgi:hypothetical protein